MTSSRNILVILAAVCSLLGIGSLHSMEKPTSEKADHAKAHSLIKIINELPLDVKYSIISLILEIQLGPCYVPTLKLMTESSMQALGHSSDGKFIIIGADKNNIHLLDASLRGIIHLAGKEPIPSFFIQFSPDLATIVTGELNRTASVSCTKTGKLLKSFKKHIQLISCATYSTDNSAILTGSNDGIAYLWDPKTATPFKKLKAHSWKITAVAFSFDSRFILTGSLDKTARLWDRSSGKLVHKLKGHKGALSALAFSPDSKTILTGSHDTTARLWDRDSGALLKELKGHKQPITSLAFSIDGKTCITGSCDTRSIIWEHKTGVPLEKLKGHSNSICALMYLPDGSIVTTGEDRTTLLWKEQSGFSYLSKKRKEKAFNCFITFYPFLSPDSSSVLAHNKDEKTVYS